MILKAICSGVVFATAVTLDQNVLIPIGTVITVAAGIWWISRKLQHIEDLVEGSEERFKRIEARLDTLAKKE